MSFPGDYGFEIAFEQQNKDTKSITWTVCQSHFIRVFEYTPRRRKKVS